MIGFEAGSRYAEMIRRVFGEEEITPPGVLVEGDRPEWKMFKREMLCSVFGSVTGEALHLSTVAIRNPDHSGMIMVVHGIWGVVTTTDSFAYVRRDITLAGATAIASVKNDLRARPATGAGLVYTNATLVNPGGTNLGVARTRQVSANRTYVDWPTPIILEPDSNVALVAGIIAESMDATFVWTERPARPEELAP